MEAEPPAQFLETIQFKPFYQNRINNPLKSSTYIPTSNPQNEFDPKIYRYIISGLIIAIVPL